MNWFSWQWEVFLKGLFLKVILLNILLWWSSFKSNCIYIYLIHSSVLHCRKRKHFSSPSRHVVSWLFCIWVSHWTRSLHSALWRAADLTKIRKLNFLQRRCKFSNVEKSLRRWELLNFKVKFIVNLSLNDLSNGPFFCQKLTFPLLGFKLLS